MSTAHTACRIAGAKAVGLPRCAHGAHQPAADTCIAAYVSKRLSDGPQEATIWAAAVTSLKLQVEGPIKRPLSDVCDLIARAYSAVM